VAALSACAGVEKSGAVPCGVARDFLRRFFSMKNFTALKCADFLHVNFLRAFLFAYCDATGTPKWALKDFACGLSPSVFTAKICRPRGVQF